MDRQSHDYAAAMAFAQQQQQQAPPNQQQQFGFPPQHQQFPPPGHGPPFIPPNSSLQQYPFPPHMQRPHGLHPHLPPHHPHHLHHQQPPSSFPPHMPPHLMSSPFPGPFDSAPPPAPPPSDPELQKVIDKLIEYYRKNGPEFEAMIRERQQDNPAYGFLFGGEGHNYYRYKLWLTTLPPSGPYSSPSSMAMLRPPPNPMMNQPPFGPPFYDHHQHSQPFNGPGPGDYDQSSRTFKGLSGPLPSDVAMELGNVLNSLTGTKESIKGAKIWFMQRSPFAPALAEALRDRVFAMDDSERQLHIVFLANDILFDSLQRRINPHELDNEALAFKPVLGSMLGRIYHNPHNRGENQSRLQKILQFWGSKEVYDHETIISFENEMMGISPSNLFAGPSKELSSSLNDPTSAGLRQGTNWHFDKQGTMPSLLQHHDKLVPSIPSFPGSSMPILSSLQPSNQQHLPPAPHLPTSAPSSEKLPPYPLFPPGLIPGMVKKMQIGSGVPYSPMSPLDIPTIIPPSTVSESEILDRVSKFFKEIGEVNPSEGPMNPRDDDDEYEREGYERESPVRKGGACIPPPQKLQVDPETGTYADGSVDRKSSGRLGLGASADPNESQYDDVYSSYRKQRSTNYHTSMSARAATATTR